MCLCLCLGIPADFDDSSVNLALGALLKETFPDLYQRWESFNSNFGFLSQAYVNYSYQPFVNDSKGDTITNIIDPRSYFWMRKWLPRQQSLSPHLRLLTTWVQSLAQNKQLWDAGVRMVVLQTLNQNLV
jgi:hypothetical protein